MASLWVERDHVTQTIYRVENGSDAQAKVLLKHARAPGTRLLGAPRDTDDNVGTGTALVPMTVAAHAKGELTVEERATERQQVDWLSALAEAAVKGYLADAKSDPAVVRKLSPAWATRNELSKSNEERGALLIQSNDLSRTTEETRRNLRAIEKNKTAEALRQKLTARLTDVSSKLDDVNRKVVELDAHLAELRIKLTESLRDIHLYVPPTRD